jgi:hypothetical protein
MRQRLRPAYTYAQMDGLYQQPHQHEHFEDHKDRVKETTELGVKHARDHFDQSQRFFIADLSCGDAAIARGVAAAFSDDELRLKVILGDYAHGYPLQGPISDTIRNMTVDVVDLFVCCETAEHVDNPDGLLATIRKHAKSLLFSTPIDNWNDENPEHLWSWAWNDVQNMLNAAGFFPTGYRELDKIAVGGYRWGMWFCE